MPFILCSEAKNFDIYQPLCLKTACKKISYGAICRTIHGYDLESESLVGGWRSYGLKSV